MLDEAEIYYTKTIALKPDHHMSWYNMGYLHQDRGHWEKSIDCFERATRILPEDVDSQINLGMIFVAPIALWSVLFFNDDLQLYDPSEKFKLQVSH